MFGKRGPRFDKVDTVIGKDTEFKGTIKSQGVLRVDGRVEGEIANQGDVIVGEKGTVVANIRARHVTIAGEVKGNIEADGKLELISTARLSGDIRMAQFVVADGASFQGSSMMRGSGDTTQQQSHLQQQPPHAHTAPTLEGSKPKQGTTR